MKLQTSGELAYVRGYKYMNARAWSVLTPFVGQPFAIPSYDGGAAWVIRDGDGWMHYRAGYCYDGPSGPTKDGPSSMRGAQVHDGCYQGARHGLGDTSQEMRKRVDWFFYEMLRHDGMGWARAWAWYFGVRNGSGFAWARQDEEIHLAPSGRIVKVHHGESLAVALSRAVA